VLVSKCTSGTWGTAIVAHWKACAGERCSSRLKGTARAAQRQERAGEEKHVLLAKSIKTIGQVKKSCQMHGISGAFGLFSKNMTKTIWTLATPQPPIPIRRSRPP
jgi:hypothetical protein